MPDSGKIWPNLENFTLSRANFSPHNFVCYIVRNHFTVEKPIRFVTESHNNNNIVNKTIVVSHIADDSLKRHVDAINKLAEAGMHFWDYGNAFLLEASRAGELVQPLSLSLSLLVTVCRCIPRS